MQNGYCQLSLNITTHGSVIVWIGVDGKAKIRQIQLNALYSPDKTEELIVSKTYMDRPIDYVWPYVIDHLTVDDVNTGQRTMVLKPHSCFCKCEFKLK